VLAGAAKLRRVKCGARALARHHHAAAVSHLQLLWTRSVQVRRAPRVPAVTGSSGSQHADAYIVTVHETNVVEVLVAVTGESDSELRQSRWRNASSGAPQSTGAVSGGACSDAGTVEAAAGPGPDPAGPAGRCGELNLRTWLQRETAVAESGDAVAGKCPRPNCVTATVLKGKHCARYYITCNK